MAAVTAVAGERGGHHGTKAADTSRARPAPRPGLVAGSPSTTSGNVANGPSTTLLRRQRPVHHAGERSQRAIGLPGIREVPRIWGYRTSVIQPNYPPGAPASGWTISRHNPRILQVASAWIEAWGPGDSRARRIIILYQDKRMRAAGPVPN
jgi:hypothetical protein